MTRWTIPVSVGHLLNYTSLPTTYNKMKIYHKKSNDQPSPALIPSNGVIGGGQSPFIISFADFLNERKEGDIIIPANRESSRSQVHKHDSKEILLRAVYEGLKLQEPFYMLRFNDSGRLCHVNDKKRYFDKLKQTIQMGLQKTPPKNKVYVLFVTQSRLMRPAGYDHKNQSGTWMYSKDDYKIFNQWGEESFSERVDDVRFVILCPLSPVDERSFESWLGRFYQRCVKSIGRRLCRKAGSLFRDIAIELRKQGLSTKNIMHQLELEYQDEKLPAPKTVRNWLLKEGLSEKRGRRW